MENATLCIVVSRREGIDLSKSHAAGSYQLLRDVDRFELGLYPIRSQSNYTRWRTRYFTSITT